MFWKDTNDPKRGFELMAERFYDDPLVAVTVYSETPCPASDLLQAETREELMELRHQNMTDNTLNMEYIKNKREKL